MTPDMKGFLLVTVLKLLVVFTVTMIGVALLTLMERRLDNVVHRLGFASSRAAARQLVLHGHITVNGRRCSIPSILCNANDVVAIKVRERSRRKGPAGGGEGSKRQRNAPAVVRQQLQDNSSPPPDWLERLATDPPEGRVLRMPSRSDVDPRINEEIKSVVATAFKINLMAMNAIFLAKRAGQAALGFSVLSNELRRFATDLQQQMEVLRQMTHGSVASVTALVKTERLNRLELSRRIAAAFGARPLFEADMVKWHGTAPSKAEAEQAIEILRKGTDSTSW